MRLTTFDGVTERRAGIVLDDFVYDIEFAAERLGLGWRATRSILDVVERGELELRALAEGIRESDAELWGEARKPLGSIVQRAPYRPRKNVVRAYGNDRLDEGHKNLIRRGRPWLAYYGKAPTAVNDPGSPISWSPQLTEQVYAEPQLAVVVGQRMQYVAAENAIEHVFGYAVCTDVSSADLKRKHEQWAFGVSLDTFFCWGPELVTREEVTDPDDLVLTMSVNGSEKIRANTADSLLSVAEVLAELSCGITLEPGDVILTGVPTVGGLGEVPERWLEFGDEVTSAISGMGSLTNPVAAR